MQKMHKGIEDMKGQKFGQLEVVQYMRPRLNGPRSTSAEWLCRCSCGTYCLRTRHNLVGSLKRSNESVCSHACPKRSMIVNKKVYVKVSERVDANTLKIHP